MMRFVFPSNLTGHPALSFTAGYDAEGLPVGMQLIGRPWEEHLLLRVGEAAEQLVERRAPKVHYRLLEG
jgi:Asp-tRNA(Asn)/Glu-tRNA(Gln) amidotransferase A subunit family amidase